ncbi:MAG: hypothetical protein OXG44_06055 [Gammaproteobacteria bacterium]|nr:hypothetical protein [Gammaproteobacteria bacterium]
MNEFDIDPVPPYDDALNLAYIDPEELTPEATGHAQKKWGDWCRARNIDPLNGGRRAWISALSTYLRDADYLVWHGSALVGLGYARKDPNA